MRRNSLATFLKPALFAFCVAGATAPGYSAVIIHEGFSANTTNDLSIDGFDGTSTSTGISGAWALTNDSPGEQRIKYSGAGWEGISGGYSPDGVNPDTGVRTFWEKNNNWGNSIAEADLSTSIDFTTDGVYYMSYFSRVKHNNSVTQVGFNDGTDELMWGNGFEAADEFDDPKGVTAYYGAINTNPITNGANIYLTLDGAVADDPETHFWVAKLTKSNSGTTDDLTIDIYGYNLTTSNTVDGEEPVASTRTIALSGISTSFDHLQLKVNGGNDGSGGHWPAIDEVRVGETWLDVTGIPEPASLVSVLVALSSLFCLRRRK